MSGASIGDALAQARARLAAGEARLLLQHVLGLSHAQLLTHDRAPLDEGAGARYAALVARRAAGEPIAYLVGAREFYGRRFAVAPGVLIPRADTELLVDLALARLPARARVLDLGTGSACIAVTLALERPDTHVVAIEVAPAALALARANVAALGARVDVREGDWFAPAARERFDLIVANPPYVADDDEHLEGGDLRFEPRGALAAGPGGWRDIDTLVAAAPAHLAAGAWLLLEHGWQQGAGCRARLAARGFAAIDTWRDLAGHERVSGGRCATPELAGRVPD